MTLMKFRFWRLLVQKQWGLDGERTRLTIYTMYICGILWANNQLNNERLIILNDYIEFDAHIFLQHIFKHADRSLGSTERVREETAVYGEVAGRRKKIYYNDKTNSASILLNNWRDNNRWRQSEQIERKIIYVCIHANEVIISVCV